MERTTDCIAEKLAAETDPLIADNLRQMLEANRRVTLEPPTTLREACQFISGYNIFGRSFNREGAGGQLDELDVYKRQLSTNCAECQCKSPGPGRPL